MRDEVSNPPTRADFMHRVTMQVADMAWKGKVERVGKGSAVPAEADYLNSRFGKPDCRIIEAKVFAMMSSPPLPEIVTIWR